MDAPTQQANRDKQRKKNKSRISCHVHAHRTPSTRNGPGDSKKTEAHEFQEYFLDVAGQSLVRSFGQLLVSREHTGAATKALSVCFPVDQTMETKEKTSNFETMMNMTTDYTR